MEAVTVGMLAAATAAMGAIFWLLLVRPRSILRPAADEWEAGEIPPTALSALRIAAGSLLVALGFLTGLALTFLTHTP